MPQFQDLLIKNIEAWIFSDLDKKQTRGKKPRVSQKIYGIGKLRSLILDLAVRGKLTTNNVAAEPAKDLLTKIHNERLGYVQHEKLRAFKRLPPITDQEKLFSLPSGWEWERLGNIVLSINSGGTPSKNVSSFWGGAIPWASVKDLNVEKFLESTEDSITEEGLLNGSRLAKKGDLIICTRMGLGKIAVAARDLAFNQDLKSLRLSSFIDVDYFIFFYRTLKIAGSGMTVAGIKQDQLLNYCIPVPPLEEQREIVTKITELMSLCDEIENKGMVARDSHEQLVGVFIDALLHSQAVNEFNENWKLISQSFSTLFCTVESIEVLKSSLIQLAVQGRLTVQHPSDGSATDLLDQIERDRIALSKSGVKSRRRKISPLVTDDLPKIPPNWVWTQNENIGHDWGQKTPSKAFTYIDVSSIDSEHGVISNPEVVLPNNAPSRARKIVRPGSVIYSTIRPYLLNVAIIQDEFDIEPIASTAFVVVHPWDSISSKYIYYYLRSPTFIKYVEAIQAGIAYPAINDIQFYSAPFPLPPLFEQNRIVAALENLLHLCNEIKHQMLRANDLQRKIADSIVDRALA